MAKINRPAEHVTTQVMREVEKYPLTMRIACELYTRGMTEAAFLAAKCPPHCPQPIWYRVANQLRDLERRQTSYTPTELKRLATLAAQLFP